MKKVLNGILIIIIVGLFCIFAAGIINEDQRCKYNIKLNDSTTITAKRWYSDDGFVRITDCNGKHIVLPSNKVSSVEEIKKVRE